MALSDLLQRIKAALGIGSSGGARQEQTTHQSGPASQQAQSGQPSSGSHSSVTVEREPATESEDAVKGTETADTEPSSDAGAADASEPDTETESEPDTEVDSEAEESAEAAGSGESVDVIKGIGPTYADRLGEAGVETVADLAAADLETLAEESGVSEGRLENWIEKAKHR